MLDLLTRRWGLKLLALAIAFAIWLAVVGQNEHPPANRPPLDAAVRDPAPRLGATSEPHADLTFDGVAVTVLGGDGGSVADPGSVRVRVVGPPSLVNRLRPARIRAVADVTGFPPRPTPYEVPLAVVLEDLSPSDLARVTARPVGRSKIEVYISDRRNPS